MGFRDILPASLQTIVQDGILDRVFEKPLVALSLYDRLADVQPVPTGAGTQFTSTRPGLLPIVSTPVTGNDASTNSYGFEQWSVKVDQFAAAIDTNMLLSATALASKFIEDNHILATQAAQSLNAVAQGALYGAYGTGTTWVTTASTTSTALVVNNANGFGYVLVPDSTTGTNPTEGLTGTTTPSLQPVSASNPLNITVNGVANTVVAVDIATNTLTLGTAISATIGWDVVASNAPVSFRPNSRATANDLTSSDLATLSLFNSAVTRLRAMNVPSVGGAYTAHVHPNTVEELFQDPAFQRVYTGAATSEAYRDLSVGGGVGEGGVFLGRFSGIDWFMNTVTPTGTNVGGVNYYRPIVCGQDALIKGPFDQMADLLLGTASGTVEVQMINGVARVWRAPLDRLGQVVSSAWSWIGGYTVGTDFLTGDAAIYKRGVVVEHA